MAFNFKMLKLFGCYQSVLIERVATQDVSAVWSIAIDLHVKLAQKSSSSSSISINNGGYYDINNDPLLGTHILRIGMQEVRKISTYFAHLSAYPRNFMCVCNKGIIVDVTIASQRRSKCITFDAAHSQFTRLLDSKNA